MIPHQKVVDGWKDITLAEFADRALEILNTSLYYDEVVLLANNIVELQTDYKTPPRHIYPLPEGFEYNFSGFWGHVLGVRRVGVWEKY